MVVNTINTNTSSISNMAMFSRQPPISVYIAERLSLAKFDSSRHMMERCDPRNSKVDWGGSPSSLVWTEVSNLDWLETSGSYKYSLIFKFLWNLPESLAIWEVFVCCCCRDFDCFWLTNVHCLRIEIIQHFHCMCHKCPWWNDSELTSWWRLSSLNMLAWKCQQILYL